MLPRQYPNDAASRDRVSLLAEVVEVLIEELSAIGQHNWNQLPLLKKQKVILASRLHDVDWASIPQEPESFDIKLLRKLVAELEGHCRQRIQLHMDQLDSQVTELQDQHQYWRECLSVTFWPFYSAIPA